MKKKKLIFYLLISYKNTNIMNTNIMNDFKTFYEKYCNDKFTKKEMKIIYEGMDKIDYRSDSYSWISRYKDFEKIKEEIIEIKEKRNDNFKLKSLKLTNRYKTYPPDNEYKYFFNDKSIQQQDTHLDDNIQSNNKKVSFSKCCKTYNGMKTTSLILQTLVHSYFEIQCIKNKEDIQTLLLKKFNKNNILRYNMLLDVQGKLNMLRIRLMKTDQFSSIPVLFYGGGFGLQLKKVHSPHLNRLSILFSNFLSNFRKI